MEWGKESEVRPRDLSYTQQDKINKLKVFMFRSKLSKLNTPFTQK